MVVDQGQAVPHPSVGLSIFHNLFHPSQPTSLGYPAMVVECDQVILAGFQLELDLVSVMRS
jgi:hypothetical protein